MARGGKRTPSAGKSLGRPKSKRSTDTNVAARVLERVNAEERWIQLLEKASASKTTGEERAILIYLENRAYGNTAQPVEHSGEMKGTIILKTSVPRPARA